MCRAASSGPLHRALLQKLAEARGHQRLRRRQKVVALAVADPCQSVSSGHSRSVGDSVRPVAERLQHLPYLGAGGVAQDLGQNRRPRLREAVTQAANRRRLVALDVELDEIYGGDAVLLREIVE